MRYIIAASAVPEHLQWTIIRELIRILGKHELIVLYFHLNVIVNTVTLAFVNSVLSQFYFVQESARFPSRP